MLPEGRYGTESGERDRAEAGETAMHCDENTKAHEYLDRSGAN